MQQSYAKVNSNFKLLFEKLFEGGNIDIKTFINKKFSLSELDITTRTIEIKNLISFIRSIKDSPQIYILEKFVKKGYLIADINLKFDQKGNIKDNFIIKGFVKDGEVKPFKKIDLSKINFIFTIQNNKFEFKDIISSILSMNAASSNINNDRASERAASGPDDTALI